MADNKIFDIEKSTASKLVGELPGAVKAEEFLTELFEAAAAVKFTIHAVERLKIECGPAAYVRLCGGLKIPIKLTCDNLNPMSPREIVVS